MVPVKAPGAQAVALAVALAAAVALITAGCAPARGPDPHAARISVVAAENQYGDVAAQVGGRYAAVTSIISNPDTDPHTYEVDHHVAAALAAAAVVVQNGLGYDSFLDPIEAASASPGRTVLVVARLLGRPAGTPNPHLWYDPATMPAVAAALAADFGRRQPAHAAYFRANASAFDASLRPWRDALASFRARYGGVPVATTEPVADYLLQAAGADDRTPWSFQADVMNGVDPAPQGVSLVTALLRGHRVRALVYNRQVTDSTTAGFVRTARSAGVPVVGVYETMPEPGYDYQRWMQAETAALTAAVSGGKSTGSL